jgi:hypothetical protein
MSKKVLVRSEYVLLILLTACGKKEEQPAPPRNRRRAGCGACRHHVGSISLGKLLVRNKK